MPSCFICSRTRNAKSQKENISFHRISKKDGIREQWLEFFKECGKDISTIKLTSAICSEHFKPDDFMKYLRNKTLHENAVPSIVVNRLKYAKKSVPEVLAQLTNHSKHGVCLQGVSPLPDEPEFMYSEPSTSKEDYTVNKRKTDSIKLVVESIMTPKDEDTPRKKLLRQSVAMLAKENKNKNLKIKFLSQKVRRQKRQIVSLRSVINVLKNKLLISEEQVMLLDSNFGKQKDLINKFCKKNAGRKVPKKYSLELRKFAVTLNFYSPKAYQFVRREFNSILPCPRTLSKWYTHVDAEPGFTKDNPSYDVIEICLVVEKFIKFQYQENKPNNSLLIKNKILATFINDKNIFSSINYHNIENGPFTNHVILLIKSVISTYYDIKIKYLYRKQNEVISLRNFYNKLTLFKGQ